jgi:hypothetical protein
MAQRFTREHLPAEARRDLDYWTRILAPVLRLQRGVQSELKKLSAQTGQPYATLRKRFYKAKTGGMIAMVDRRLCGPLFWQQRKTSFTCPVSKCHGLQQLWKRLCEENKRKARPEYDRLVKMWKDRHADIAAISEYASFPGWPSLPPGWTYTNLMRFGPDRYELAAARKGLNAAKKFAPTVYTTRRGLYVGSHYLFDDKWHDFFVNTFAEKKHGRPLEVYSLDLFSACKRRFGIRVRTKDQDGNYKGVAEVMMRYVLASTLYNDGYSPRGTTLVAEHGTAAVRGSIADALSEITGGLVTLSESGMLGDPAHMGQYPGLVRGNPNHKAALESNNSLEHNYFASVPGQTGNSVENRPEELHGRLDHNATLLAAYSELSAAKAALLDFPLLELNQFMDVANEVYARIANTRVHELEGWIESGNVMQAFRFGRELVTENMLDAQQRAALATMLESGLLKAEPVRMTRQEVWNRGADDLIRLPGWGVVAILGDDLAREVRVTSNMIAIKDDEIGPGIFRFEPFIRTAAGDVEQLVEGEAYEAFINPFSPDMCFVRDAKKRYLGESQRILVPSHGDFEGVRRAIGESRKREAALLAPLRARHAAAAREMQKRHAHNADVIGGPEIPKSEQRATAKRRGKIDEQLAAATRASTQTEVPAGNLYGDVEQP